MCVCVCVVGSHGLEEERDRVRLCGLVEEMWRDLDACTREAGLLARTALALLALEYLEQPPESAIEHAAVVLADEAPISAAWAAFPGTHSLSTRHTPRTMHMTHATMTGGESMWAMSRMTTIEQKAPITSLVGVEVFRELARQQPELSAALAWAGPISVAHSQPHPAATRRTQHKEPALRLRRLRFAPKFVRAILYTHHRTRTHAH